MTERKWTSGPWVLQGETLYGTDFGYTVPIMDLGFYEDNERYRNDAHLIAAAPELYENLADLVEACERLGVSGGNLPNAKDALAKAKGEA